VLPLQLELALRVCKFNPQLMDGFPLLAAQLEDLFFELLISVFGFHCFLSVLVSNHSQVRVLGFPLLRFLLNRLELVSVALVLLCQ
jgi:hypothetical protein